MIGNELEGKSAEWNGSRNSSIKSANGYHNDMLISLAAMAILLLFLRSG